MRRNGLPWRVVVRVGISVIATGSVVAVPVSSADGAGSKASGQDAGFLDSSSPKTVVLDPSTGDVVSVTFGLPDTVSGAAPTPEISSGTTCGAGDGCYYTPTVDSTYHDRSFYGSPGSFHGSWPRRNAWATGSYTASACWSTACSATYGPNTYLTFGGSLVTGTSFTIH